MTSASYSIAVGGENGMLEQSITSVLPQISPDVIGRFYSDRYRSSGRVHIPDFLSRGTVEQVVSRLEDSVNWSYFLFAKSEAGDKKHLWEVTPDIRATYSPDQDQALHELAYACVKEGYGFIYETNQLTSKGEDDRKIRLPHTGEMARFEEFVNSQEFLQFSRDVTGADDIRRAEPNATSFGPGQFLASHDDSAASTRRVAFVFNYARGWKPDFGGLLQFIGKDGHVEEAFVPYFNSLNLFRVPQAHSVSCVAPFAPGRRLAISGWLHA